MTLKRTTKLLKEYLKMNNIIELTDTAEPSSYYFNNEIILTKRLF